MDLEYYMSRADFLICNNCGILSDIRDWQDVDVCPYCSEIIEFAIDHTDLDLNNDVVEGNAYL